MLKKFLFGFWVTFFATLHPLYAGVTVVLDLDDTVLKEAPVSQKAHAGVQSITYQPSAEAFKRYQERLVSGKSDPSKVIHYELHSESHSMTGYIAVRPGMEAFLKKLAEDPTNKILIASSNDPKRTEAIVSQLKVGGKTLSEWGAQAVPKEVFNPSGSSKDLPKIRTWAKLPESEKLFAIDDHPEFYVGALANDQVLGVTPWDQAKVSLFLSPKSDMSKTTVTQETEVFQKLLGQIVAQAGVGTEAPQSSVSRFSNQLPPFGPKKHFNIPHHAVDLSGSSPVGASDQLYTARPDISKVEGKAHGAALPAAWAKQKQGHLEAVAEILEMYPDRHIYFLARDGELLYDYAKTVLADEPEQLERVHLLNVSRANMNDPHLIKYLAQEGISVENLKSGMKAVFVDTGFNGTIPKTLSDRLLRDLPLSERVSLWAKLQTHLLASSNPDHPSTRVFLESVHPKADELSPGQTHGSIISYEHMPRVTHRARAFKMQEGRWHPAGSPEGGKDGQVDPVLGRKYMEDLKHYALSDDAKTRWNEQRAFWRQLRQLMDSEKPEAEKRAAIETELKALLASKDELKNHKVRDALELVTRNEPTLSRLFPTASSLGLKEIGSMNAEGSKFKVIEKHPEWATILDDPATEIPKLIHGSEEQIQTLRQIIDVIDDDEIKMLIAQNLFFPTSLMDPHHQEAAVQTFKAILEKNNWGSKTGLLKDHLLAKAFNEKDQTHLEFIQAALKAKDSEVRRAAALALGCVKGYELSELFEKALNDENEDVRKAAISSLRYRQPSDDKTYKVLVNLLKHANLEVRKEIAALIQNFYPRVQKSVAGSTFKNYLAEGCVEPIHQSLASRDLQIALAPILANLSTSGATTEPHPIIPIKKDDPRVAHLSQKFKDLGEMHLAGGLIWSGVGPHMDQNGAMYYCKGLGARLPTADEYRSLSRALGSRDPERKNLQGYNADGLPGLKSRIFWSSSSPPSRGFACLDFYGDSGFIGDTEVRESRFVRCVAAAWGF